ncbi:MAG: pyridoxal kinase [Benjaminiella poitrasii]|nr:MAG: pyridoxal kinase [Benjaminiella poitrasii]
MIEKLKRKNPNLIYVCDTVMGDCGSLYVSPEIIPLYKNIMKSADVVTPNQFESEILSEMTITSLKDACQVAKKLHTFGPPNVVITTLSLPLKYVPADVHLETSSDNSLYCFTSQLFPEDGRVDQYLISFPTYEGYFTGTGDLFSSLVVARLQEAINKNKSSPSLIDAVYRVVCSVNTITKKTWLYQKERVHIESHGKADLIDSKPNASSLVHSCELRLIQGKKVIEDPESYIDKGTIKVIQI